MTTKRKTIVPGDGMLMTIYSIPMTPEQRAEAERNAHLICPECDQPIAHRKWIRREDSVIVHRSCPVYTAGPDGRLRPRVSRQP